MSTLGRHPVHVRCFQPWHLFHKTHEVVPVIIGKYEHNIHWSFSGLLFLVNLCCCRQGKSNKQHRAEILKDYLFHYSFFFVSGKSSFSTCCWSITTRIRLTISGNFFARFVFSAGSLLRSYNSIGEFGSFNTFCLTPF